MSGDLPVALPERWRTSAGTLATARLGRGPALVLAHGWPWSSQSWHRVLPALARQFTVHLYDMPGYGCSEMRAGQPTGLDVQGRVFAEMAAHWGLDRPLVWAHDMGGATVLRAHLLHGVELSGLALMNVVAMRPWGSAFFDHVGRHVEAFQGVPPHIHAAIVEAYIGGALARPLPAGDAAMLARPWLGEAGRHSFYAQFAQADEAFTAEIEPAFGACRCPVRVFWGEDDPWIPLERGAALAQAMGVPLAPLPGLGHLPQLEDAGAALAAVLPFLQETAP
ncbi:alpha/beta fold hydrolase [Poseidonocella sp. HB161398]|uniref:alpha/beta fold hydrolase n=1 Tax=Poseidonocella sp. HB161398 TaxID=2320855 RepID=UPI001F0F71DD|nr:alpha/beta hydrolase [Poseidonocella sp. HB161398]